MKWVFLIHLNLKSWIVSLICKENFQTYHQTDGLGIATAIENDDLDHHNVTKSDRFRFVSNCHFF
jgi:hypothetical protein